MKRQQVCGTYESGQAAFGIHVDGRHQIESQQRQVCQVVLRERLAAEVRVNAAQSAKASRSDADAFEVGQLDAAIVADHHVLHVTLAIDQRADLSACFVRQLADLASEFRSNYLARRYAPTVQIFYAPDLVWL